MSLELQQDLSKVVIKTAIKADTARTRGKGLKEVVKVGRKAQATTLGIDRELTISQNSFHVSKDHQRSQNTKKYLSRGRNLRIQEDQNSA